MKFWSATIFNLSFSLLFLSFWRNPRLCVWNGWNNSYPCFSFGGSYGLHKASKTNAECSLKCVEGLCRVDINVGQFCAKIGIGRVPFLMYKSQQNRSHKIQNGSVFFQLGIFCRLFSCENQIVSIITGRWGVMFDLGSTVIPVKYGARTALLTAEYKKRVRWKCHAYWRTYARQWELLSLSSNKRHDTNCREEKLESVLFFWYGYGHRCRWFSVAQIPEMDRSW